MYKFQIKGIVVQIPEPKVCRTTGFVKRQILVEDENGHQIAPEFHPRNFRLLTEIKEGDLVDVSGIIRPNKNNSAHFLVVDGISKN